MNEPDVVAVLTEVRNNLTERGIRKSDDAAVLEHKGGAPEAVTHLRDAAMVDLEAARRIRELKTETPTRGRRGPNKTTTNGGGQSAPTDSSATPALPIVSKTWGGS